MTYPLGVDIGTTYTAAALWRDGRVQTVPLGDRANAVPSVLFLRDDDALLVGEAAVRRGTTEPGRQAREFKRRMGDDVPILLGGRGFSAHQLIGQVLRWVVDRVSELQGGPPDHVVLTHPAEWGDYRRGLLAEAARAVGLADAGLLPEPVAAATWYAAQERIEPGSLIGIYDFGGGTFDASVVRKTNTGVEIYGAAGGDDSIGGVDFDHALFRRVSASAGIDIDQLDVGDPVVAGALAQLFSSVVDAKEALSADVEAVVPVVLPGITRQVLITRAEFEELIRDQVFGTVGVFGQVVHRAGIDPAALHAVLLVGGSSRIPLVRQLLATELGIRVAVDAHPKYTVSLGAAIAAAPRITGPAGYPAGGHPAGNQSLRESITPQPGWPGLPGGSPSEDQRPVSTQPAITEQVDLAGTGLTSATDVPVTLVSIPSLDPPARIQGRAEVVRTRDAPGVPGHGRGRLAAVLVVAAVVGVVATIAFFALRSSAGSSVAPSASAPTSAPSVAFAGSIRISGTVITPPDGPDTIRGMARLPSGNLIAVGLSAHQQPRAWIRHSDKSVTPVQPPAEDQGVMADVTVAKNTAIAVGWTGIGNARRAAVWTSTGGEAWQLLPAANDFAAGTSVRELTAVTVDRDGKLIATGIDRATDPVDGDAAVFSSTDGKTWSRVPTTGLGGSGPQTVSRLTRIADGTLVAVGSTLAGAHQGPAVWTSADGMKWQLSPYVPDGSPTLLGVVEQPDGALLTCGSIGSADKPSVGCWTQRDQQRWEPWNVIADAGSATPLYLYGMTVTPGGVVMSGAGRSGSDVDATIWTARLEPARPGG